MQRAPWLILSVFLVASTLSACAKGGSESVDQHFNRVVNEQTELIQRHITDPRKRERLLAQVDKLDRVLVSLARDLEAQSDSMDVLMRDHAATEEQLASVNERFNARQDAALAEIREIRNESRRLTTREEWARISARRQYKVFGY